MGNLDPDLRFPFWKYLLITKADSQIADVSNYQANLEKLEADPTLIPE